jgi:hypothetical protein
VISEEVTLVKTSLKIDDRLWEEAKARAARERKDLADVINEALAAHLKKPVPKPRRKEKKNG